MEIRCYTCGEKMKCYDDVNTDSIRIDFCKCDKCNSKMAVHYNPKLYYITKVTWDRE